MFQPTLRSAPRRVLVSKLPWKSPTSRRVLSTAPPSQKPRTWKSSAARWAIAIGGVYYYNTSSVFAEQPNDAISRVDQSLHQLEESNMPTLDSTVEKKRQRLVEQQVQSTATIPAAQHIEDDQEGLNGAENLEEGADQQGAFNPETGEINWNCPCLGGMAHGPCGEEFKAAFSCFVYSKEEPKGMECIDKFKGMQDCFRQYPEMYGSELEDDEDELEEELRADVSPRSSDTPYSMPTPVNSQPQSPQVAAQKDPGPMKDNLISQPISASDEGDELAPKAARDGTLK